jgi:hypothetical protein
MAGRRQLSWGSGDGAVHASGFVTFWSRADQNDQREERHQWPCQHILSHKRAVRERFGMIDIDKTGASGGV